MMLKHMSNDAENHHHKNERTWIFGQGWQVTGPILVQHTETLHPNFAKPYQCHHRDISPEILGWARSARTSWLLPAAQAVNFYITHQQIITMRRDSCMEKIARIVFTHDMPSRWVSITQTFRPTVVHFPPLRKSHRPSAGLTATAILLQSGSEVHRAGAAIWQSTR